MLVTNAICQKGRQVIKIPALILALSLVVLLSACGDTDGAATALTGAPTQLAATATAPTSWGSSMGLLKPGDKLGDMLFTNSEQVGETVLWLFCENNGASLDDPCKLNSGKRVVVGTGWPASDQPHVEQNWPALQQQLFVDGREIDLAAFGTFDEAFTGSDSAGNKRIGKVRRWNVVLENVAPGLHVALRKVAIMREIDNGWETTSPGTMNQVLYFTIP